jgi:hypothetical protein
MLLFVTGNTMLQSIRGMGPEGLALRPEIRLINGRMFRRATHELIVGKSAQGEFEGSTLIAEGIGLASLLGLFGGILPALRATRVPVAVALRDS